MAETKVEDKQVAMPSSDGNKLPAGWKWMKLGDVCEVITGTTPPKANPKNYGKDIPFFKPPHLWDGLISETDEMLSLLGAENARVVPPNVSSPDNWAT